VSERRELASVEHFTMIFNDFPPFLRRFFCVLPFTTKFFVQYFFFVLNEKYSISCEEVVEVVMDVWVRSGGGGWLFFYLE
jgi:hypothetical protein